MRLKSIVSRDPRSRIGFGFRGITDVRNAEVDISAFKGLQVRLPVGKGCWREGCGVSQDGVAVSIILLKLSTGRMGLVGEAI